MRNKNISKAEELEETRKSYWNPYFLENICNFLELRGGMKILDVGCGTGFYCRLLAKKIKADIIGIDIDNDILKKANELSKKENLKIKYLNQDAFNIQFKDNTFDLVWCQTLLCNLKEPEKVIGEMIRVSKNKVVALEPYNSANIRYFGNDFRFEEFYKIIEKVKKAFENKFSGDHDIGAKLFYLFHKLSLEKIEGIGYCIIDIYEGKETTLDIALLEKSKDLVPKYLTEEEYNILKSFNIEPPIGSLVATPVFIVKGTKKFYEPHTNRI